MTRKSWLALGAALLAVLAGCTPESTAAEPAPGQESLGQSALDPESFVEGGDVTIGMEPQTFTLTRAEYESLTDTFIDVIYLRTLSESPALVRQDPMRLIEDGHEICYSLEVDRFSPGEIVYVISQTAPIGRPDADWLVGAAMASYCPETLDEWY